MWLGWDSEKSGRHPVSPRFTSHTGVTSTPRGSDQSRRRRRVHHPDSRASKKNSSRHERKKCKAMILENIAVGIQSFLMGNVSHVGDAKRKKSAPTNRCIYFQSPVYLDLYIYREILPTGSIFHHPCSSKPLFLQVPILPLRFPALTHPALLVTLKLLPA